MPHTPPAPGFAALLRALPKTETHLHLEGALPYSLLRTLDPAQHPEYPCFHGPEHRFASFTEFDRTLIDLATPWFTSADRYHQAAQAIFANHLAQNVRYVETSFHLPLAPLIRTPAREILAALRAAVPPGLEVRIFAGMTRDCYQGELRPVIDALADWDELDGIDLHGHETLPNESWTAPVWQRVRAAGKLTKAHAGEFGGPERVREALVDLGATRIQHGIRAVEDPAVLALARDLGATFDVCPLSNLKLRVVPDLARHPLRALLAAGLRCTVSTDDPLLFGQSLEDEYLALHQQADYTPADCLALLKNGWTVALLPLAERTRRLAEIDAQVSAASSGFAPAG